MPFKINIGKSKQFGILLQYVLVETFIFFYLLAVKSSILDNYPTYIQSLRHLLVDQGLDSTSWTACYRSREHGWNVNTFHSLCDLKGPTLLVARSHNKLFGGVTEQSWGQGKIDSNEENR
jgi:hypothetical protein